MTKPDQDAGTAEKSGGSIGFLRAAEKMQISTFEIPLIFLEDLGFSKDRIQAAKDFNRRFVSGFYGRVRKIGGKFGGGGGVPPKVTQQKTAAKKTEVTKAVKQAKDAPVSQATPSKAAKQAETKTPAKKASRKSS